MSSVADWLNTLNDFGFDDVDTADKLGLIQSAIWDIEAREPWYFLEQVLTLTFSGASAVPSNLPADMRAVRRITNRVTGRRVGFKRVEDLEDRDPLGLDTVGTPVCFYFEAGQLRVYRVPAATDTLRLRYFQISDAITAATPEIDILIPPRHHAAVLYGSLALHYARDDDFELASYWDGKMEQRIQNMRADLWQRQFDTTDYIVVVDPDDWDYE